MSCVFATGAERNAALAQSTTAFAAFSLINTRIELKTILQQIGREGIFGNYTMHDISHVDAVLNKLDWIIPQHTKDLMTPADWLLIVLSAYFHDLGMLVTKQEYDSREQTEFVRFRDEALRSIGEPEGYPQRVMQESDSETIERFLYEEFVRANHAMRIHAWITNEPASHLGIATDAQNEVSALLAALPESFRYDLGLVCLSHHREDLHDLQKYKTQQRYGSSEREKANVHFAAILLRTSDLLHITSDRAPSVLFRLISPANPLSQWEWAKQAKVRSVNDQIGIGRDGRPDIQAPRDTIEVHATYRDPEAYFGLTDYLRYCENQIAQCYSATNGIGTPAPQLG